VPPQLCDGSTVIRDICSSSHIFASYNAFLVWSLLWSCDLLTSANNITETGCYTQNRQHLSQLHTFYRVTSHLVQDKQMNIWGATGGYSEGYLIIKTYLQKM